MSNKNLNWSYQIANTLCEKGVKYICLCPGSRNTPLTVAFTSNHNFICSSHIDERSAAYFALGISKKIKSPSVIISTSGTAVANFFPAIIESSLSKTPIIVITADRPAELINTGENQTINQKHIYGEYVRSFYDLGLPSGDMNSMNKKIISSYNSAIGTTNTPPGPSHINIPFDEPLIEKIHENRLTNIIDSSIDKLKSKTNDININYNFTDSIIVCGGGLQGISNNSIIKLSEHIKAPIFADPTSGVRYNTTHENIISSYNLFIDHIDISPKTIIKFGAKPVSKTLSKLISKHDNVIYIDSYSTFNDNSKTQLSTNPEQYVEEVIKSTNPIESSLLLKSIIEIQAKASKLINNIDPEKNKYEGTLINQIINYIEPNSNIFIGNSKAIRELDNCTLNLNKKINILSNRGASGIDGLVSTALGVSHSSKNINIAILGDLSFYYDMNGLLSTQKNKLNTKFIILNNNGGGIFSDIHSLNIDDNKFEKFWTTPHNLDLKNIANLYNIKYHAINNISDIKKYLKDDGEVEIIEFKISIKDSLKIKNKIKDKVRELLSNL